MKLLLYSIFTLLSFSFQLKAQEEIQLYKDGAKQSNGITEAESKDQNNFINNITDARMYAYIAPKETATGAAVLICPGGGYSGVSSDKEGSEIAIWFNQIGISAFVLYYRMPNGHYEIPLLDAQAALKIIHKGAKKWHIRTNKIGIMGFSAGGHLASTVGTHFKTKIQRPDFMILAYPVVTMKKDLTHLGSRINLLGNNPSEELVNLYSNELQVSKETPPTFIVHAIDDNVVPIANSEQLLKALLENNVPAELHKFDVGGHGFGMRKNNIPADNWPELLKDWLIRNNLTN